MIIYDCIVLLRLSKSPYSWYLNFDYFLGFSQGAVLLLVYAFSGPGLHSILHFLDFSLHDNVIGSLVFLLTLIIVWGGIL